jgi:serine/threonine protein kinase/Cdc6-like AAA superfamily ATPase
MPLNVLSLLGLIVLVLLSSGAVLLRRRHLRARQKVTIEPPFGCDFTKYEVAVPLKKAFRFAHEPLTRESNGRFVGRKSELEALALRIMFSDGGSFLVTGYRGVGKTTFVNQVVRQLEEMVPWAESIFGETKIIDVQLNLARPVTAAELMHHIIRRLYEQLKDKKIFPRLSSSLQDELKLAYDRTSFNMTRTLGEETEKSLGLDQIGLGGGFLASLKGALSYKKTRSEGSEYQYVGYDDKAAEHDIVSVSRKLSRAFEPRQTFRSRVGSLFNNSQPQKKTRLIIVFVFDELDKLEEFTVTKNGRTKTAIDELLSALKNVFTTSGVSFVFVAGKDTQERWLEDLGKGDSVYESVFAYDKYLPCMWTDVNALCDGFVDWHYLPQIAPLKVCTECRAEAAALDVYCAKCGAEFPSPTISVAPPQPTPPPAQLSCASCAFTNAEQMFCSVCGRYLRNPQLARSIFEDFKKYLDYRGRGIPRRVIRGFNEYVFWSGERPILVFTKTDLRRIRVYAELQDLLAKNEHRLFGNLHEEVSGTMQDKRRLGVYYLTDWILRQGNAEFSVKDAVAASKRLSAKIAPAEEIALNVITDIVAVLLAGEFLMEVEQRLDKVQIGDVSANQEKRYKLAGRRLIEMRGEGDLFEAEAYIFREAVAEADRVGHYQLLEKVGTGGMGTVYRAWNERTGQIVAVKILAREFAGDPQAVERFKRESEIMNQLRHPNIVKCYETAEDNGRLFIAMEFVEGIDLGRVLNTVHQLELSAAITIARCIADALHYVHNLGFVRNDIKPGNVMLSKTGNCYLMDFGITKLAASHRQDAVTLAGTIVGTPYYMSPEQFQDLPVDARSDIYSCGIVIYEMITGQLPFKGKSMPQTIYAHLHEQPIPPSTYVPNLPSEVDRLVLHCLEKDPGKRFQNSAHLLEELKTIAGKMPAAKIDQLVAMVFETTREATAHAREDTKDFLLPNVLEEQPPPSTPTTPEPKEVSPANAFAPSPEHVSPQPSIPSPSVRTVEPPIPSSIVPDSHLADPEFDHDPKNARLVVTSSPSSIPITFGLRSGKTQIGRDTVNEITLQDVAASRFHADIEFRDGAYYLRDLNTSNGTLLNGVRVLEPTVLHEHDLIQIGSSILRFELK